MFTCGTFFEWLVVTLASEHRVLFRYKPLRAVLILKYESTMDCVYVPQ